MFKILFLKLLIVPLILLNGLIGFASGDAKENVDKGDILIFGYDYAVDPKHFKYKYEEQLDYEDKFSGHRPLPLVTFKNMKSNIIRNRNFERIFSAALKTQRFKNCKNFIAVATLSKSEVKKMFHDVRPTADTYKKSHSLIMHRAHATKIILQRVLKKRRFKHNSIIAFPVMNRIYEGDISSYLHVLNAGAGGAMCTTDTPMVPLSIVHDIKDFDQ